MVLLRVGIVTFVLSGSAQNVPNLVRNGDASNGVSGWMARGQASVEGTGADAHFVVRNRGEFVQTIDLPPATHGQFVVVVGRGASDRINQDGSITGLPYLYGLFGDTSGTRFLGYLQGQRMRLNATAVGEWLVMSGTFSIPAGTARLILRLSQASRRGDPQNGSAARFDDVGVYVVATENQANALIANWPNPQATHPAVHAGTPGSASRPRDPLEVFYGSRELGPLGPPSDPLTTEPFVKEWGVILPEAEGYKVARPCSRRAPAAVTGVWRPDGALIASIDQTLAPLVQGALERAQSPPKPTWSSAAYYRQYLGIVVNGRRVVYVNAFRVLSGRTPPSWELQFLSTCDGGYSFFGAEYEFETGRVQHLSFNGR